jgi:AraC family transcriptional regulator
MKTIHIKNMVCDRCKIVVSQTLEKLGLHPEKIVLGEVILKEETLSEEQQKKLDSALVAVGFERIDDRKGRLIESVKKKVIEMIHHSKVVERKFNWSYVLSEELHYDYNYISNLFSSVEGTTLEQYIIAQKIERAKELLFYDELTLGEISQRLGYSSIAHLSAQFKKVTGLTPSELKKSRNQEQLRKPIDSL